MRVNRHYMRLSQETLGTDVNIDISQGTCTMKYSPKIQEHVATRNPGMAEIHPLQDESTIQGILHVYYQFEQFLKEISGMDGSASSREGAPRESSPTPPWCAPTTPRAAITSGTR